MRSYVWAVVLASVIVAGCDSKSEDKKPRRAGSSNDSGQPAQVAKGNGVVRGKVILGTTPPVMQALPNAHCAKGGTPIMEETVIVGAGGGLKNVLVSIEGIGPSAPNGEMPVLDQVNCTFTPHVMGVAVGQEIVIKSSDPTFHNVHIMGTQGDLMNIALPAPNVEQKKTFGAPDVLHVKCDVHPWMSAYIGVFENPFFAVTGDDGSFEIKNVPAGSYKLSFAHEQYGKQERSITVADDKPAQVEVTYGK